MQSTINIQELAEYVRCPLRYYSPHNNDGMNNMEAYREALIYTCKQMMARTGMQAIGLPSLQHLETTLWRRWKDNFHSPELKHGAIFTTTFLNNIIRFALAYQDAKKITGYQYVLNLDGLQLGNTVDLILEMNGEMELVYPQAGGTHGPILNNLPLLGDILFYNQAFKKMPTCIYYFDITENILSPLKVLPGLTLIRHILFDAAKSLTEKRIYTIQSDLCASCQICHKIDTRRMKMRGEGDKIIIEDKETKEDIILHGNETMIKETTNVQA